LSPGNLTLMLVTMAPWYTQLVRLKPVSIRIRNGKTTWQEDRWTCAYCICN
jgi:hypothetical protein